MPCPPPMQADPTPSLALRLLKTKASISVGGYWYGRPNLNSCTKWAVILDPDAARGWPKAIAPPSTLTLFTSSPRSLMQDSVCAPNASFICNGWKLVRCKSVTFWIVVPRQDPGPRFSFRQPSKRCGWPGRDRCPWSTVRRRRSRNRRCGRVALSYVRWQPFRWPGLSLLLRHKYPTSAYVYIVKWGYVNHDKLT